MERICLEEDCDRTTVGWGRCRRHYYKWRRAGEHPEVFGECSWDGCPTGVFVHGLCHFHFTRQKRGIDLDQPSRYGRPVAERFWSYVNQGGNCWVWQGGLNAFGYGTFHAEGRTVLAHRFAYDLLVGPIPEGLELDHLCSQRDCVNPAHLEPVTHTENVRRAAERKDSMEG